MSTNEDRYLSRTPENLSRKTEEIDPVTKFLASLLVSTSVLGLVVGVLAILYGFGVLPGADDRGALLAWGTVGGITAVAGGTFGAPVCYVNKWKRGSAAARACQHLSITDPQVDESLTAYKKWSSLSSSILITSVVGVGGILVSIILVLVAEGMAA